MTAIELEHGTLSVRLSTKGGIVLGFWSRGYDGRRLPLLRPAPDDGAGPLQSGCYPLVPFGNRISDNRFHFEGRDYRLEPNTAWDPHYLHGDAWLGDWQIASRAADRAELTFSRRADRHSPYSYDVRQTLVLDDKGFCLTLEVTNRGSDPMPFGLGWHPYFPMTPQTTLQAPARRYWTERPGWLPGAPGPIPADVDFSSPRALPKRWVNNGFESWSGKAEIIWPEHGTRLCLTADPLFRHAFIFLSDATFDPAFRRDYFCLEPMSHLANGHNMDGLGDLVVLGGGESLAGSMRMFAAALHGAP